MTDRPNRRSVGQPSREPFFWARLYGRRLSWPVTLLVLRTPLSANAVSVVSILIGLAGGVCLAFNRVEWNVAAVALLIMSWVLDCVDGEVARVRGTCSLDGEFIDACRHQIVCPALFAGLTLGVHARHPDAAWLVALGLGATVLSSRFVGGMIDQMVLEGVRRAILSGQPVGGTGAVSMTPADTTSVPTSICGAPACQAPWSGVSGGATSGCGASLQREPATTASVGPATTCGGRTDPVQGAETPGTARAPRRLLIATLVRPLFVDFNIMHILLAAIVADALGARADNWTPLDAMHVGYGVAFPIVKLGSMAAAWRRGVSGRVDEILRGAGPDAPHH